jgi:hypothetical protein
VFSTFTFRDMITPNSSVHFLTTIKFVFRAS